MGILGIENRTENWKTARVFSPFFEDRSVALAERLLKGLGEPSGVEASEVRLELFWYGMRDYLHIRRDDNSTPEKFAERYSLLFPNLRKKIEDFCGFEPLADHNYCVSELNQYKFQEKLKKIRENLYNNLRHTEIDIVLETPKRLFVGEAKHESYHFGTNGNHILVHQLIRQHVMAKILIEISRSKKEVTHFLVGDRDKLNESGQVKFMKQQEWLEEGNILSWDDVKELT